MAKYAVDTMVPLQEENSQKFEYLIPTVKSSPESKSSNIPIQPYKKEDLLSINHVNLGPFSPRTQSMIDELEKHFDELANSELATSDDPISIFDSPHEIKSDVTLDFTSIPLITDIKKDSEGDIPRDLSQIDQNSLANDPGSYNNKTYYTKDEKSNKSEKIRLSLEKVSFNLKNVILDQEIRVQVEDDQALNNIGLDSPRTFKVLPVNFDPSLRIDSNVKKSIRIMVGLVTYHTKPSTSLEEQLKKSFLFPFNYHSFVFDTMKLIIYEYGSFLNKKKKCGRVIVQLSALKQTIIDHKEFEGIFPIKANGSLLEIGAVQINIKFHFSNDPPLTPLIQSPLSPWSPISRDCSKDDNDDNIEAHPDAVSLGILDTVLRQETRDAIKEITALYHTFFGHGWSDIICWVYGQKAVSVPNYMVIRDPETNSIFISIRGSMNITDLITDALAHYEPWNGGFVHRGAFRSAQYLINHSLKEIRDAVVKYNINSIKIMGHSLGASISSITTLLLREHCKDMLDRGIDIHAWNFATFPCCSLDLASKADTMKCIYNFVNENDIIPRLSYGNLMDFKELVKFAASELKNDEYKELRSKHKLSKIFSSIDEYRKTLKLNSSSQKLYIPGKIYYIYKRSSHSHLETSSSLFHNKEVVCEESRPDLFTDICLRRNWLFHHFPDRYDKRLKGVIKFLTKESVERTS
ncbi:27698_t:CDS:2 [Dentiscutata erythropus]|uniref:sn-1-specific diacylglycerol lipase n=1 Tax=Dentiscutata erythropus TaxID=1348616 RepID=A0A9N9B3Q6_9GLOM|nr:27698_t:CDS:2 [Dentiscutata erythropus]